MATLTIETAIERIEELGPKIAKEGVKQMQMRVPYVTGDLYYSIGYEQIGDSTWSIGTSQYYAKWVDQGRGPVKPIRRNRKGNRRFLHWEGPKGDVFARRAGPAPAQNFAKATADALRGISFSL